MMDLKEALAALPRDMQRVAQYLEKNGIRGRREDGCYCPLANWLSKKTGKRCWVYYNHCYFAGQWNQAVTLPDHLQNFILAFEEGFFPSLIEEG